MISGESGRICHIAAVKEAMPSIWLANREIAEYYELSPYEMDYILNAFPVFARKRNELYGYLIQQIGEWKIETELTKYPDSEYSHVKPQKGLVAAESRRKYSKNNKQR